MRSAGRMLGIVRKSSSRYAYTRGDANTDIAVKTAKQTRELFFEKPLCCGLPGDGVIAVGECP